jgi:hypothetical protein
MGPALEPALGPSPSAVLVAPGTQSVCLALIRLDQPRGRAIRRPTGRRRQLI